MKILHTSDWHIGRKLYSRKRYEEFEAFFDWLREIVIKEKIDILIVSGDIFDNTTPGNRAQQIYYNFLRDISRTECSGVVITGGNHDSPTFLNAPSKILSTLDIHIIGDAKENLEEEVLVLKNSAGEKIIICAVPYLRDRDLRNVEEGESISGKNFKIIQGIKDHYEKVLDIADKIDSDIPVVAMGHLFATGGKTFDDDGVRDLYVGTIGHIGAEVFPETIDYLALGHLHIPQKVGGRDNFRYSGSPIPMGFNEANQIKKVIKIEFNGKHSVVNEIEIPCFRKLASIKGDLAKIEKQILELKQAKLSVWIEIIYEGREIINDLRQRIEDYTKDSLLDVLRIKNQRVVEKIDYEIENDKGLDELDIFQVFDRCLDENGITSGERIILSKTYRELIRLMEQEDKNAE